MTELEKDTELYPGLPRGPSSGSSLPGLLQDSTNWTQTFHGRVWSALPFAVPSSRVKQNLVPCISVFTTAVPPSAQNALSCPLPSLNPSPGSSQGPLPLQSPPWQFRLHWPSLLIWFCLWWSDHTWVTSLPTSLLDPALTNNDKRNRL